MNLYVTNEDETSVCSKRNVGHLEQGSHFALVRVIVFWLSCAVFRFVISHFTIISLRLISQVSFQQSDEEACVRCDGWKDQRLLPWRWLWDSRRPFWKAASFHSFHITYLLFFVRNHFIQVLCHSSCDVVGWGRRRLNRTAKYKKVRGGNSWEVVYFH